MKTSIPRAARAAVLLALAGAWAASAIPAAAPERGPRSRTAAMAITASANAQARVIVKYRADSAMVQALSAGTSAKNARQQHAQEFSNRLGLVLTDGRAIGARAQVVKGQGLSSDDLAARLSAQSDVEYAVVDGRVHSLAVPNDPLFPAGQTGVTVPAVGQWYLRPPSGPTIVDATSTVSAINAQAAWDITTGSSTVVVADLDTGVRYDHPDLAGKILPGYDFINSTTVSNDGDGRDADASDPGDYGCPTGEATSSWHGTQTAGLIAAATNNGAGMASVGYNVMLLPVRVLGVCGGYDSDIQAAILWAAGVSANPVVNPTPAKVINMSLGSAATCSAGYADVVRQANAAGVVVVAAAGNDGLAVGSPANCPGIIAVAGTRHAGTKVGYSDLGPEIAISAPAGNCVNAALPCLYPLLTTSNSGTTTPVLGAAGAIYTGNGADATLGTSFATPLVTGTVALMFSANPSLSPAQVLAALKSTARPFPSTGQAGISACVAPSATAQNTECYCTTATCGAGMLDTGLAVAAVAAASANITVASTAAVAGTAVTLDGSTSRASTVGASITAYQWAITSGPATFTSATNGATATLLPSAAGSVVASLTVTDSTGHQATSSVTLSVAAPTVPTTPTTPSGSSGGGGGALEPHWLLAWLAAVAGTWVVTPRACRRR